MNYVVLFYGDDGTLGRTIGADDWDGAVAVAKALATQEGMSDLDIGERLDHLVECGNLRLPHGSIHIGGMETSV